MIIVSLIIGIIIFFLFWRERAVNRGKDERIIENTCVMAQTKEDESHYRWFEEYKISYYKCKFFNEYLDTILAIERYPDKYDIIDNNAVFQSRREYEFYLKKCHSLKIDKILSERDYVFMNQNFLICGYSGVYQYIPKIYTIYHAPTAKYLGKNIQEELEKEFKQKYGW